MGLDEKESSRLEAFSDGVIAVAITLLVLTIKIPGPGAGGSLPDDNRLWQTLLDEWPTLLAFATSFLTVGIIWINHHRLFHYIKRTNTGLLLLNLLLLFVIVIIPVPTSLLAEYLGRPDQHAAAQLYSGALLALACCFNLVWRYATYHGRLLDKDADMRAVKAISRQYIFGPLLYILAFAMAWVYPSASIGLDLLFALFFALPPRLPRHIELAQGPSYPE